MTVQDYIELIPQILVYCIPGFIGVHVFRIAATGYKHYQHLLMASCAASYISIAVVRGLFIPLDFWAEVIMSCLLCVVGGWILGRISQSRWLNEYLMDSFHLRLSTATISSSIDWTKANATLVYLKSTSNYYLGSVKTVGDDGGDGWIAIACPAYYTSDGTQLWDCQDEKDAVVVLNLDDIQAIRVINDA